MTTTDTPPTDAVPKRYMTVVYEITDENEWRKTNPLRYAHNGLNAVRVCVDDACELLDETEAEVERLRNGMQGSCYSCEPIGEMNQKLEAEVEKLKNDFNQLKTLMHQTIWIVDDMIKTHANGCEDCHKKHGAMIALFKDITIEPQWPIDPTNKYDLNSDLELDMKTEQHHDPDTNAPPLIQSMQVILKTKEATRLTTSQYLKIEVSHEDGSLVARSGIHEKIICKKSNNS
jgi:hypothetical protein